MVGSGVGARRDKPDATGLKVLVAGIVRGRERDAVAENLAVITSHPQDLRANRLATERSTGRHFDLWRAVQRDSLFLPLVDGLGADVLTQSRKRLSQSGGRLKVLHDEAIAHGSD